MSVNNGQDANQDTYNNAFMSRTTDTSTTGEVDLENANAASGPGIENAQRSINGVHNFVGSAPEGTYDQDPSWSSDALTGTLANESIKDRVDAVQAVVEDHDANKVDAVAGTDNALIRNDGTAGAIQNSGIIVDDSNNITGVNDLTIGGDLTVNGTTTTINTATLDVEDVNITINKGGDQATAEATAGLTIEMSDATDAKIIYDSSVTSKFKIGESGSEVEVATISGSQVFTDKDIDGGTASDTSRLTLPKNTTTNLDGLSDKEGTIAYDTTLGTPVYNNGSSWQQITGEGGSGGINYLSGDSANFGGGTVGNWTTFDDGSVSVPVDGDGGTPANISVAQTTTIGEGLGFKGAALAITKANTADSQGEGAVCAFTIPESQQGKQQSFSFSIKSGSGFVNSLFRCFIYDVTNSEVINVLTQESGELFATPSTGSGFTGTWIASSNSTSYRAIIMCTGTATDDFEFYITDIVLGPIGAVSAFNSHGWEDVTITGSWVSNSTYTGKMKRVGDSALIDVRVDTSGAPTSATLTITLPNGLAIDTNKTLTETQELTPFISYGTAGNSGSRTVGIHALYNNASSVVLVADNSLTAGAVVNATTPFTFGAGDFVQCTFLVPIANWQDSDIMSTHRADLRTLKVLTAVSSGTHDAGSGVYDDMTFTEDVDTHSSFDGTTFTAPFSGEYAVDFNMFWASNAIGIRLSTLLKNGTNIAYGVITTASTAGNSSPLSQTVKLAKGDTLKLQSYQDSGGNLNWSVASLQIVGTPDFSVFGVKGVYEYLETENTSDVTTVSVDTFVDSAATLTLSPGTWMLGYNVGVRSQNISGGSTNRGQIVIRDSSNNIISGSQALIGSTVLNTSEQLHQSASRIVEVTVTEETTYKMSVKSENAAATATQTLVGTGGFSTNIAENENASMFWARRQK